MKQYFFTALTAVLLTACHTTDKEKNPDIGTKKNYPKELNLKGGVKTIQSQGYEAKMMNGYLTPGEKNSEETYKLVFDSSGLLTENTIFDKDGGIKQRKVYTIVGNRSVKMDQYDVNGYLMSGYFEYTNDRLSKITYKNSDSTVKETALIKINDKNIWLEDDRYDERGIKMMVIKNDIKNDLIVQTTNYDSTGVLTWRSVFTYNKNEDVEGVTGYYKEKLAGASTNKYYYDKYNNWIKKEVFSEKGVARRIILRTITYN